MNPSLLILGGAVGLGTLLLIVGIIYERRHHQQKSAVKSKLNKPEPSRSRVYELQMRDHRRSLIWTTTFTALFIAIGLFEWLSFNFQPAWPTMDTHSFSLYREEARERRTRRPVYFLYVDYTYVVRGERYLGRAEYKSYDVADIDQRYNELNGGMPLRVWYHPLIPAIGLHYRVGPVFAFAMFSIAGLCGLGVLSSGVSLVTTKLKGGPKQRVELKITKGDGF